MVNNIKITIIIPTYNSSKFIERTLDSICNQTFRDFELLCVDDCSTDDTCSIIAKYVERDDRIKLIQKKKHGERDSSLIAFEISSGEYFVIVDHDDELELDYLQRMYEKAQEDNYDVVACNIKYIDATGIEHYGDFPSDLPNGSTALLKKMIEMLIISKNEDNTKLVAMFGLWSKLYKRSIFENYIVGMAEGKTKSIDFMANLTMLLNAKNVAYIPDLYYHYFYTEGSQSRQYAHRKFDTRYLYVELAKKLILESNSEYKGDYINRLYYRLWMVYTYSASNELQRNPAGIAAAIRTINQNMDKPLLRESLNEVKMNQCSPKGIYRFFMLLLYVYTKFRLICTKKQ